LQPPVIRSRIVSGRVNPESGTLAVIGMPHCGENRLGSTRSSEGGHVAATVHRENQREE
jgi:hypothetical protein